MVPLKPTKNLYWTQLPAVLVMSMVLVYMVVPGTLVRPVPPQLIERASDFDVYC